MAITVDDSRVQEYIEKHVDKTRTSLLIIDKIPKVPPEKVARLTAFLRSKIKDKAREKEPTMLKLPADEAGVTLGYALAAFDKAEDADEVLRALNGLKFDKSHTLKANLFTDWEKYKDVSPEYKPPAVDMNNFQSENLYEYLCDENQREQFFIRYHSTSGIPKNKVEIHWNDFQVANSDVLETMEKVYHKDNWTQLFARWSPLGTYFVTFHEHKIVLWGGSKWSAMGEFPHSKAQFIDFSPKEKYLITWGSELIVWDVQICKKVRRVHLPYTPGERCPYKWSHDEQFLAKLSEEGILMYDLEKGMRLVQPDKEKASTTIHMPGVRGIEWSPTDNYFCYWVPEAKNLPARVTLVKVVTTTLSDGTKDTTFETIARRNLYRVEDIRMTWHPQGDYLACKVERKKKPNQIVSTYEMFRIRHKDVAVETIELAEQVIAFDFEPKGHRFAVIHGVSDVKLSVSFYTMNSKTGGVALLGNFKDKKVNHIYWSPRGKYCLLAGLRQPFNGVLEFWNVQDLDLIETTDHFMCSNVNWDASGRFVTTFVSQAFHQMENGFRSWTFQGKLVCSKKMEKFYQFEWRPRPASVLSDKDFKKLVENKRPQWEKRFAEQEAWIRDRGAREAREKMTKELRAYRDRMAAIKKHFAGAARERRELQIQSGAKLEFREVTVTVEELIDRKEVRMGR